MQRGGYRPGAGRKKEQRTLETEKAREYIIRRVVEKLEPIVNRLIEQAENGDKQATQILFERAFGKTPQAIEMPGTGEIIIKWQS